MISIEQVLAIHSIAIKQFGGSNGIRDTQMLESAIKRPFQTFGGEELYPSIIEKAAAIIESILMNHPFVDGNKRTGYILMKAMLMEKNITITTHQNEVYNFVIAISTGEMKFEAIVAWLKENTKAI
jgi:death-on-curing protein